MAAFLTRFDPFRDLGTLQQRMNQIFDDTLRRREGGNEPDQFNSATWAPPVDIYETADTIVVNAEVPGIPQEAIDIQVADGVLTIKGERKFENEQKNENFHRVERSYGSFIRSFSVPPTVDVERISATYDHGVLRLELPKKEERKPRKVEVRIGAKSSAERPGMTAAASEETAGKPEAKKKG